MLIDHIGAFILEPYCIKNIGYVLYLNQFSKIFLSPPIVDLALITRLIGRLAFPIFCYFIVEGYLHTRNKEKYILRMFIFALVSIIPFNMAHGIYQINLNTLLLNRPAQNVFFTLCFGLVSIYISYNKLHKNKAIDIILKISVIILIIAITGPLNIDYSYFGLLLIVAIYLNRKNENLKLAIIGFLTAWEITAPLCIIPLYFYNGKRGKQNKYFYYLFYPCHLAILGALRYFII